jgi:integrase
MRLAAEWYKSLLRAQPQHPRIAPDSSFGELFPGYKASRQRKEQQAYAQQKWSPIRDFWAQRLVTEIKPKTFLEFFQWRRKNDHVSNSTLHKDVVLVRQLMKHAADQGIIEALPRVPNPGEIPSRGRKWLNQEEWKHLLAVSNERIREARNSPKLLAQRQDCHDFAVFMVHSMMRVEELRNLRFSDCRLDTNNQGEEILICDVSGKTGPRQCVCLPGAASVYKRRYREDRNTELIFPHRTRDAFRSLLEEANLLVDPSGHARNLKSLRSTSISFRVLDGSADIFAIARNAGTSVQMIDTFYAKPLGALMKKDELTSIRKQQPPKKRQPKKQQKTTRKRRR